MNRSAFIKALIVFLTAFPLFVPSSAFAQTPVGLTVTLCSKLKPEARPVVGVLIDNPDSATYRLYTELGEFSFRRADFGPCKEAEIAKVPEAPRCPEGQISGPQGCACPANLMMKDGRCVAPPPPVVIDVQTPAGRNEDVKRQEECARFEDVIAQGSGTVGVGVMPYLIQGFANAYSFTVTRADDDRNGSRVYQLKNAAPGTPCLRVTIRSTGSNDALPALIDGTASVGMSSRVFEDAEIEKFPPPPGGGPVVRSAVESVVALDAVVVVLNPRNPVQSLELCDIARIYAGKYRDWSQLGGRPGAIKVHMRSGTSGTYETFESLVMKNCHEEIPRGVPFAHRGYGPVLSAVASDEAAIGFAPLALLNGSVGRARIKGKCGLEQEATQFNVKTEDYLLARRLFVFTPVPLEGNARRLVNFIKGDDRADDALSLQLPSGSDATSADPQGHTLDQKIELARDDHARSASAPETTSDIKSFNRFRDRARSLQRLSISYRFRFNSTELDTKARQDIQHLVRHLQKNPSQGTLHLAGFTDNVGGVEANLRKAADRAEAVRNELIELGALRYVKRIEFDGFGKILPVACNDTELGQEKNRRVEVYLAP